LTVGKFSHGGWTWNEADDLDLLAFLMYSWLGALLSSSHIIYSHFNHFSNSHAEC